MTSLALSWLRDVMIAVERHARTDEWLRPNQVLTIIQDVPGIEIPGLRDGDDLDDEEVRNKVYRAIGRKLKTCVPGEQVRQEGMLVERRGWKDASTHYEELNEYRFGRVATDQSPVCHSEVVLDDDSRNPVSPGSVSKLLSGMESLAC